ncbi:MAG: hypothetical protein Q9184_001794 [Pyrenodesmia sp. 2 TL-2023]
MAATLSRSLRSSLFQTALQITTLPPIFLLPLRARLSTIANTTDPELQPSAYKPGPSQPPPSKLYRVPQSQQPQSFPSSPLKPDPTKPTTADLTPSQTLLSQRALPPSPTPTPTPALLPLLAAQPPHYITAHIHAHPYLLTPGDTLRLPFLMPSAPLGTILRLNRASMLGSRDYTLRGAPWVDERWFVCRARVVSVETESLRVVEKTKRRMRHVKRAKNKMRFTVLRVLEVGVRVPEEGSGVMEEGSSVIEEGSGVMEEGSGVMGEGTGAIEEEGTGAMEEASGMGRIEGPEGLVTELGSELGGTEGGDVAWEGLEEGTGGFGEFPQEKKVEGAMEEREVVTH